MRPIFSCVEFAIEVRHVPVMLRVRTDLMATTNSLFASLWVVLLIVSLLCHSLSQSVDVDPHRENRTIKCRDVRVRSNTINLEEELRNCTVIVGYLHIVRFDGVGTNDFSLVSYPNLTEITGHLLIYRVKNLTSIGQLFPNLTRIHGKPVFWNYGLILSQVFDLLEVCSRNLLK